MPIVEKAPAFEDEWVCEPANQIEHQKSVLLPDLVSQQVTTRAGRQVRIPNRELPRLYPRAVPTWWNYDLRMRSLDREGAVYVSLVNPMEHRNAFAIPVRPVLVRRLGDWPRLLQLFSFVISTAAFLAAAGGATTRWFGVALGFLALSSFFFANFSSWRRDIPYVVVGPYLSVIGMWGALIIALAVFLNGLVGS